MLMTIYASNLTDGEGGVGQYYTTEDYIRAIQHGVNAGGRALVIMPSIDFQQMREEELGALVAYIQSLPPVDNVQPELALGPMGRVLIAFDLAPLLTAYLIDHDNAGLVEVEYGANLEYGAYLAVTCQSCHGQDLTGGLQVGGPSAPQSANITPHEDGIAGWTLDDFITTIRTGINPDGEQLRAPMPWQQLGNMTDEELEAIYLYLQTVEPQPDNE
jgi:mono/diheme cytochrome c family protein